MTKIIVFNIEGTILLPGISQIFSDIKLAGNKLCIFTSLERNYAESLLKKTFPQMKFDVILAKENCVSRYFIEGANEKNISPIYKPIDFILHEFNFAYDRNSIVFFDFRKTYLDCDEENFFLISDKKDNVVEYIRDIIFGDEIENSCKRRKR